MDNSDLIYRSLFSLADTSWGDLSWRDTSLNSIQEVDTGVITQTTVNSFGNGAYFRDNLVEEITNRQTTFRINSDRFNFNNNTKKTVFIKTGFPIIEGFLVKSNDEVIIKIEAITKPKAAFLDFLQEIYGMVWEDNPHLKITE